MRKVVKSEFVRFCSEVAKVHNENAVSELADTTPYETRFKLAVSGKSVGKIVHNNWDRGNGGEPEFYINPALMGA